MKTGDKIIKVVHHPVAGKCLIAKVDIPKGYKFAYFGNRGRCPPCNKEDRAISYYPPNKITGKNRDFNGERIINYNGVINPKNTGDVLQYGVERIAVRARDRNSANNTWLRPRL